MTRTKEKRPQKLKVKAMILFQNSQYSWNTFFENYAFEFLQKRIRRGTQNFLKEKLEIEIWKWNTGKYTFGTIWLPN